MDDVIRRPASTQRPGGGIPVKRLAIGLLAAFLLGVALTVQARNWWAIGVESGGSCGSGGRSGISRGSCPRSWGMLFTLSFVPLFALVPLAIWGALKPPKIGCLAGALAVVLGVFPGIAIFEWAHGPSLKAVWSAPKERPSGVEGEGSWLYETAVVRARFDGLIAYDIGTGDRRWTYTIPAPAVLCTMSRTTEAGVGLVGFGAERGTCDRIAAVDLKTGRALWEKPVSDEGLSSGVTPDQLAVARGVGAAISRESLRGFALSDGSARWEQKLATGCSVKQVAGGGDQIVAVVGCSLKPPTIRAIDAATGKNRWEAAAPMRNFSGTVTLLSAGPVVAHVRESGQRGVNQILSYDERGRVRATIEVEDDDRRLDVNASGFSAAPVRSIFVQGDVLVALASGDRGRSYIQAYGLGDGRRRWSVKTDDVEALQAEPDRVLLLRDGPSNPSLESVSMRDGKKKYLGVTPFDWLTGEVALYSQGGRYVVVCERATTDKTFPVAVVKVG